MRDLIPMTLRLYFILVKNFFRHYLLVPAHILSFILLLSVLVLPSLLFFSSPSSYILLLAPIVFNSINMYFCLYQIVSQFRIHCNGILILSNNFVPFFTAVSVCVCIRSTRTGKWQRKKKERRPPKNSEQSTMQKFHAEMWDEKKGNEWGFRG